MLTALEGEVLAEQVRLADAAREIVRNISTELSMETLLAACNEAMVEGFGAVGLWIQTFDSLGAPGSGRIWAPEGIEVSVPDVMRSIAELSAHDTWRRQTVDVVRVGDPESLLPDARAGHRLRLPGRASTWRRCCSSRSGPARSASARCR